MYLIDSDAFICIRRLSILQELIRCRIPIQMMEYAACHELSMLAAEINVLVASNQLTILAVIARTPAAQTWKQLKKDGVDKGEAEAIAWLLDQPVDARPIFISLDAGARKAAHDHHLRVDDVLGLGLRLAHTGVVPTETLEAKFAIWDDKKGDAGRPSNFQGFSHHLRLFRPGSE